MTSVLDLFFAVNTEVEGQREDSLVSLVLHSLFKSCFRLSFPPRHPSILTLLFLSFLCHLCF